MHASLIDRHHGVARVVLGGYGAHPGSVPGVAGVAGDYGAVGGGSLAYHNACAGLLLEVAGIAEECGGRDEDGEKSKSECFHDDLYYIVNRAQHIAIALCRTRSIDLYSLRDSFI